MVTWKRISFIFMEWEVTDRGTSVPMSPALVAPWCPLYRHTRLGVQACFTLGAVSVRLLHAAILHCCCTALLSPTSHLQLSYFPLYSKYWLIFFWRQSVLSLWYKIAFLACPASCCAVSVSMCSWVHVMSCRCQTGWVDSAALCCRFLQKLASVSSLFCLFPVRCAGQACLYRLAVRCISPGVFHQGVFHQGVFKLIRNICPLAHAVRSTVMCT
ncbi:hypothetical protein SESBI_32327 [Sesbania bispinosa]|nr:hypothetical protein SESBI_32327 [Sesbania bispinosa]